jgi:hypothetical protein
MALICADQKGQTCLPRINANGSESSEIAEIAELPKSPKSLDSELQP